MNVPKRNSKHDKPVPAPVELFKQVNVFHWQLKKDNKGKVVYPHPGDGFHLVDEADISIGAHHGRTVPTLRVVDPTNNQVVLDLYPTQVVHPVEFAKIRSAGGNYAMGRIRMVLASFNSYNAGELKHTLFTFKMEREDYKKMRSAVEQWLAK